MIPSTEYNFYNDELRKKLLPILKGKVFHVTSYVRFKKIQEDGLIRSHIKKKHGRTFAYENSYGRLRGYVCLFDLRNKKKSEINHGLDCFYFLGHRLLSKKQTHLIIKEEYYSKLIDTQHAKAEVKFSELFVPHIECWYPANLPLSNIQEVVVVNIKSRSEILS